MSDIAATRDGRSRRWIWIAAAILSTTFAGHSAPPFTYDEGCLVFEAEDVSTNISPRNAHNWTATNAAPGFAGSGYMDATPDNDFNFVNWPVSSPEL